MFNSSSAAYRMLKNVNTPFIDNQMLNIETFKGKILLEFGQIVGILFS